MISNNVLDSSVAYQSQDAVSANDIKSARSNSRPKWSKAASGGLSKGKNSKTNSSSNPANNSEVFSWGADLQG